MRSFLRRAATFISPPPCVSEIDDLNSAKLRCTVGVLDHLGNHHAICFAGTSVTWWTWSNGHGESGCGRITYHDQVIQR